MTKKQVENLVTLSLQSKLVLGFTIAAACIPLFNLCTFNNKIDCLYRTVYNVCTIHYSIDVQYLLCIIS